MQKYYFDVTDAGHHIRDAIGVVLNHDDEARDEALDLLPALARDVRSRADQHEIVVAVRDEAGAVVYEASLSLHGRWWPGRR